MKETITGLYKTPGKLAELCTIPNTLASLQAAVGGFIEPFQITTDVVIICDEEGKLKGLEPNFSFCGELFAGPVFVCGVQGENFVDLKEACIPTMEKEINRIQRFYRVPGEHQMHGEVTIDCSDADKG